MPRPSSWTATSTSARPPNPTFYKLTPDGKVRWSYRNPAHGKGQRPAERGRRMRPAQTPAFKVSETASSARRW